MERNIIKCNCCNSFFYEDEAETVTLKIQKHKECDINALFPAKTTTPIVSTPKLSDMMVNRPSTDDTKLVDLPIQRVIADDLALINAVNAAGKL